MKTREYAFDNSIGYNMGLSRIVVFFPYFLLGYYMKDVKRLIPKLYRRHENLKKENCLLFLLVILLTILYAVTNPGARKETVWGLPL